MFNPVSTYRVQFHSKFTFENLTAIIPYLKLLGVKTIYASPIFKAVAGSTHGYDCTDTNVLNPEIGSEKQFIALVETLKASGINWIQDIVPNHMAYDVDNPWIYDILKNGQASRYSSFFDINWESGKLMLPILNEPLEDAIASGDICVQHRDGETFIQYKQILLPVSDNTKKIAISQLLDIINAQHYELCAWQTTNERINYRRFFTINGLICLNMQNKHVFYEHHKKLKEFVDKGYIQGVRVDHVDGLHDPGTYLQRLKEYLPVGTYIVVEKILQVDEQMSLWPIQGTTGYDFLAIVNNLFTKGNSKQLFNDFYLSICHQTCSIEEDALTKKAHILNKYMGGELNYLSHLFNQIPKLEHSPANIKDAIAELLIYMPVYRLYGNHWPLAEQDRVVLKDVFKNIKEDKPSLLRSVTILEDILLNGDEEQGKAILPFYQRCMQYSCVLMAKGIEDTQMYTYSRFIAHNEVGDAPEMFGIPADKYHSLMKERLKSMPLAMLTTSTHDTKRGEDARARLNVLSEMPQIWLGKVKDWLAVLEASEVNLSDKTLLYFIMQTIVGSYQPTCDIEEYRQRLVEYLRKALREGKVHSDWEKPDQQYEQAIEQLVAYILDKSGDFLPSLENFLKEIVDYGYVNSLAQMVLKLTSPGMPDIYQGCELWDFSFADPDNRREVDYGFRLQLLQNERKIEELWQARSDGAIKQWLCQILLYERAAREELFAYGDYIPLEIGGLYKEHVLSYARVYEGSWCVVIVPLFLKALDSLQHADFGNTDLKDTHIVLPVSAPSTWKNKVDNDVAIVAKGTISIDSIFRAIPLAVLINEK